MSASPPTSARSVRARAQSIARLTDDPVEPRAEGPPDVEAVEGAERGEKGFLGDVLGGRRVLHDEIGGAMRARPVLAEQGLQVRDGSGLRPAHPGGFSTPEPRHRAPTIRTQ